jgi:hypothetical protein
VPVLLIAVVIAASGSRALAGNNTGKSPSAPTTVAEGSTATHRLNTDWDGGEVYIYVGGTFPVRTHPAAFRFLFDFTENGNTTGYITPLLFERISGEEYTVYAVVGIGKGFEVALNPAPQTIPIDVIEGSSFTTNGNFTFGYVNSIVDLTGVTILASLGTVDFDQPADAGEGLGGVGATNVWEVTAVSPYPTVALGTTFGVAGSPADYTFWPSTRTYSAQAIGIVAPQ